MFIFDPILQLYISDTPLLISARVLQAAKNAGISISWNNDGHVNRISYHMAKKLCRELNSVLLSVQEFMHLAKRLPCVASHDFAEWLNDTFTLSPDGKCILDSSGGTTTLSHARPAWFELDSIGKDGLPTTTTTSPDMNLWKFWTPGDPDFVAAATRSFVTSSGTCSLDLGIPAFAQHSNFMIRECYREHPPSFSSPLDAIWPIYESKTFGRNDDEIEQFLKSIDPRNLLPTGDMDAFEAEKDCERLIDLLGKRRLLEADFDGLQTVDEGDICNALATPPVEETTYVTGHSNPDADAIVSSIFEATRRYLVYTGRTCVAWAERVPPVVKHILGARITTHLCNTPRFQSHHDIVLVDCHNMDPSSQHQVKSVIDHHIISKTFPYYVSVSQEVSWSSTIQVYIKMLGSGLDLNTQTARILLEATRLEAEPSLLLSMSKIDKLAIRRLETLAGQTASYDDLMALLISGNSTVDPFMEDYKQTLYGFAVIKTQRAASFEERALKNNVDNHLPLTIVKQVICNNNNHDQFGTNLDETISLYFNENFYDKGFRSAVKKIVTTACEVFHSAGHVEAHGSSVIITDVPSQTPRLLLMPLLEDLVREHLKFFYSPAINKYVSCGFFSATQGAYGLPSDKLYPTTCISFDEVKRLLANQSNTSFLSLRQYWKVYHERTAMRDTESLRSLRDKQFVELLDTVINKQTHVTQDGEDFCTLEIKPAKPALIRPDGIDEETGFPKELLSPNTYGETDLWRYWSPDREENVTTRGHIFIMDQTSIDLKIGRYEKTKQLTFRPVYQDVPDLKYNVSYDGGRWVEVKVFPRLMSVQK